MIKPNLNFNFPLLPSDWVYITEIFLYFINANGFWTIPHTHWCLIYIFAKHIHKKGTYNFAPNNFFIIARLTRTNTYIFGYFKGLTHALRLPNFSTLGFLCWSFYFVKMFGIFCIKLSVKRALDRFRGAWQQFKTWTATKTCQKSAHLKYLPQSPLRSSQAMDGRRKGKRGKMQAFSCDLI